MKYWISCSLPGVYGEGEIEGALSLEDARAVRDAMNDKCKDDPEYGKLWVIVDEDGKVVD